MTLAEARAMSMKIWIDPTPEQIEAICAASIHNAAKWLRANGKTYFWKPEDGQHAEAARLLHAETYEKGLAVPGPKGE